MRSTISLSSFAYISEVGGLTQRKNVQHNTVTINNNHGGHLVFHRDYLGIMNKLFIKTSTIVFVGIQIPSVMPKHQNSSTDNYGNYGRYRILNKTR